MESKIKTKLNFFPLFVGRPSRKSEIHAVQKVEKSQFETPPSTASQVELTSSGRRRIRPLKFNDFADIKPKSASNENLVARYTQPELETPVKERRRRRRGDREVIEMGSPLKDYDETKRTRYHTNSAKLEGEERTLKRKNSMNDDEIEVTVHKRQRMTRESSGARTPTRHTRGRSITASGTSVKEDLPTGPEKAHKRRRTTGIQSIDEPMPIEEIQIKEEPRINQPELTRFGKLTASAEKSHRENRLPVQPVIKSEQIEAPRRGRKPKPKQPVFESDTQSESTDAGRKFPVGRPPRLPRPKPNFSSERRSSRNLSTQEQPNSPLTGASTEPSGDELLKSGDKRTGRRHPRRTSGAHSTVDQEVMQPPTVENHSEDDIDSIVDDEPIGLRKTKTKLAEIFTKAAGKRGKRKRSSPIVQQNSSKSHGHRTSGRIAAAAAKRQPSPSSDGQSASTPHHSHGGGGTSSDDQQFFNKKQMTLPEMMQMQKAKNSVMEQR